MKVPETPPNALDVLSAMPPDERLQILLDIDAVDGKGRYLHWEELKYKTPPKGLSNIEYWAGTKYARMKAYKALPLVDMAQLPFHFCVPDSVLSNLHELDKYTAGNIQAPQELLNTQTQEVYLVSSLIEEAISSSQLEGAVTTREVAKEMLKSQRAPQDHSEQMIFNNHQAMTTIQGLKDEALTPALIKDLQRILTEQTLEDESKAGEYRKKGDDIHVFSEKTGTLLHTPSPVHSLEARISALCDFANNDSEKTFIHPIVKGIILHFMLGYIHPFFDGNGRTARALFYWYVLKKGYWLMSFISISSILKEAQGQYAKAYLHTETDGNDLTYFIIHQLGVINKAVERLHQYLLKKKAQLEEVEELLDDTDLMGKLNYRQLHVIKHAAKHPAYVYKIADHQAEHRISYQTARTDLMALASTFKLLRQRKDGRAFVFVAPVDIVKKIRDRKNTKGMPFTL